MERAEISHCTFRLLVFLYLWDFAYPLPNGCQLIQRAYLIGKNLFKEIDGLVYKEVNDGDFREKPWIKLAFLFVDEQNGFDFVLPVVSHTFFALHLTSWPRSTLGPYHSYAEVRLASNAIHKCLLLNSPAKQLWPVRLFHDVGDDCKGPSYEKVTVLKKREVTNDPVLSLDFFELRPLIRIKEAVMVGEAKILAKEPAYLTFGSERIVGESDRLTVALQVHCSMYCQVSLINVYFLIRWLLSFIRKSKNLRDSHLLYYRKRKSFFQLYFFELY